VTDVMKGRGPDTPAGADVVAAFKALGDQRRLRTLLLLHRAPEPLCGCEIADVLGVPDYQVSRDLAALRRAGLVRDLGRTGTWVHYEPVRGTPIADSVLGLVTAVAAEDDDARLALRLGLREQVGCVLGPSHPDVVAAFERAGLPIHDR
jgi:ArsR family transcriptional regulator, arsenate/arsenite/antimonite-responsive transcriptional repressor